MAISKSRRSNASRMGDPWLNSPELIKRFLSQLPDYEQLCNEVAYTLKKRLRQDGVSFSTVSSRAKTLESFVEKLSRKDYSAPFDQITDFAGARVVCLYIDDLPRVEAMIRDEFKVLEKVDKLTNRDPNQFGYGAIHYLVKLGRRSAGARYDDLKDLVCEVQVRTVLQDAWAIIDHHLVYKRESDIPRELQRKLNGLAGLFETADDQFRLVRDEREQYLSRVSASAASEESFLANDTNYDSLVQYLGWKFPNRALQVSSGFDYIFADLDASVYPTLREVDALIDAEAPRVQRVFDLAYDSFALVDDEIPSAQHLGIALALRHDECLDGYSEEVCDAVLRVRREMAQ